ncbi:hypothetical protein CKA32_000565 [Geitlerinema sp. FC II]|nr:hypothetical protein CKA32_000565 [Geitlerinema sp. FC II]
MHDFTGKSLDIDLGIDRGFRQVNTVFATPARGCKMLSVFPGLVRSFFAVIRSLETAIGL